MIEFHDSFLHLDASPDKGLVELTLSGSLSMPWWEPPSIKTSPSPVIDNKDCYEIV